MSIYIKGMEMPTRCGRCDMRIPTYLDDGMFDNYECCITAAIIDDLGEKMEDCPLVPVPHHGRLIDADALMAKDDKDFSTIMEMTDPGTVFGTALADAHTAIQEMLKTAPTIIPAEEGE